MNTTRKGRVENFQLVSGLHSLQDELSRRQTQQHTEFAKERLLRLYGMSCDERIDSGLGNVHQLSTSAAVLQTTQSGCRSLSSVRLRLSVAADLRGRIDAEFVVVVQIFATIRNSQYSLGHHRTLIVNIKKLPLNNRQAFVSHFPSDQNIASSKIYVESIVIATKQDLNDTL